MTDNPDRIERTLELLLYAPIGIGMFLKDTAPTFVDMFVSRGRAEIDRRHEDVQQRVTTARSLGQVALAFGAPMLRQKVERTVTDAYHRAEGLLGSPASDASPPRSAPAAPAPDERRWSGDTGWSGDTAPPPVDLATAITEERFAAPAASLHEADLADRAGLPIPGYDALSASQVVERLVGLAPDELSAVHEYESSHRQRRTILGKIEQLAG